MGMTTGGGGSYNADINVTPLVDVVLVLLIIFMVIVPLTQRGFDIEIPKESVAPPSPDVAEKQVILSVNETGCPILAPTGRAGLPPNCMVRINKEEVAVGDVSRRLGEVFRNRKAADKILFLAVQEKLNYEGTIQILDLARAGVGEDLKIGIVIDEGLALATP